MTAHERRLIRFFENPAHYPHPVGKVLHRETHISHIFLAGPFAYKLKKPVRFPFLDASTLARRRRFCRLEVDLNRRLAPDLYVGVIPIVETAAGWSRQAGSSRQAGLAGRREIRRVMEQLIPFFKKARRGRDSEITSGAASFSRSRAIGRVGKPRRIAQLVLGNLRECRTFVGSLFSEVDFRRIEAAFRQFLLLQEPLFLKRVAEGRIIDGHGDLRCENICLTDPVTVFDCVEFEPRFRYGDRVNDLSFLVMDLEFRGRSDLAGAVLSEYRRRGGDTGFESLLLFYQCHRSLVRGKVRGLIWRQHPRGPRGERMRRLAIRHFRLARRYAEAFAPPLLLVVGGVVGTGKSTLAKRLAGELDAVWLRTDEIRRKEFARFRRPGRGFSQGLYAPWISRRVYQRLIRRAEEWVRQNRSVVCDGTFLKAQGRQALKAVAEQQGARFHFFECVAPREVAMRRITRRLGTGVDLSEARPELVDRFRSSYEPVLGWGPTHWTRLDTRRSPTAVYQEAIQTLRRAWIAGSNSKG